MTEIQQRIDNQKKLCAEKNLPHFAPADGICWNCYRQIYERKDGNTLVTGCPHCGKTYCD